MNAQTLTLPSAHGYIYPTEPKGRKVYEAISAITGELAKVGIAKGRKNSEQNYAFRGIDDIYAALSSLLAQYKLCVIPRVQSRTVSEQLSKSGRVLFYTVVDVEFDLVSAEDGSMHTARVCGEAMDSGDKSSNKAMSAAYKYFALQTFCIPTEGDNDTENQTHEIMRPNIHDPNGLPTNVDPREAKKIAGEMLEILALDIGDDFKAMKVADYHDKHLRSNQDMFREVWKVLKDKSKERAAWKSLDQLARAAEQTEPRVNGHF